MSDNGSNGMSQKGMGILVVAAMLIMVGFGAFVGLSLTGHDPRTAPHDYVFDGTYDGTPVSGTGHSEYFNENANIYIYRYTFVTTGGAELSEVVVLDPNGVPDSDYAGEVEDKYTEQMEGQTAHKYVLHDNDAGVPIENTIWVGSDNTVLHMQVSHGSWNIDASLADPVYSIEVSSVLTMHAGETKDVGVSWYPSKAPAPELTYRSSATSVATVDSDGRVSVSSTAAAGATCEITVTSADGKLTGKCTVVVV